MAIAARARPGPMSAARSAPVEPSGSSRTEPSGSGTRIRRLMLDAAGVPDLPGLLALDYESCPPERAPRRRDVLQPPARHEQLDAGLRGQPVRERRDELARVAV